MCDFWTFTIQRVNISRKWYNTTFSNPSTFSFSCVIKLLYTTFPMVSRNCRSAASSPAQFLEVTCSSRLLPRLGLRTRGFCHRLGLHSPHKAIKHFSQPGKVGHNFCRSCYHAFASLRVGVRTREQNTSFHGENVLSRTEHVSFTYEQRTTPRSRLPKTCPSVARGSKIL